MRTLLHALVSWLPAGFRARFGTDVDAHIDDAFDAAEEEGGLAVFVCFARTLGDLLWVAVAERARPTWMTAGTDRNDSNGDGMMMEWIRDLALATRSLRRAPGFVVTAVVTLSLAIGLNAAIFAVVQKVLIEPLPYPDSDRLVHIAASAPGSDFPDEFGVSVEFLVEYAKQTDLLEGVAAYNSFTNTFRVGDRVERVRMSWPTNTLFDVLGSEPLLGRLPRPEDEDRVFLLSHAAFTDWFGGDEAVIGESFDLAGEPRTLIGVMGPEFQFPRSGITLWLPNPMVTEVSNPGRFGMRLVARVAPDARIEQVEERLTAVARRLPELYGGDARYARLMEQHRPVVRRLDEQLTGGVRTPFLILMGAVLLVLVIACANVTNLFLVRAERRQRDLAVRRAIGAGWRQLARLQLAEAVLVAGLSGLFAASMAAAALPTLVASVPDVVPRIGEVTMSVPSLLFTLVVCVLAALLCGLPPALRAAAAHTGMLREGARGTTRSVRRGRDLLVTMQTALALVLLVGSGLLWRSFNELRSVDPGFDVEDVLTFQIAIEDEPGMDDGPSFARFHLDFMERLRALPGVESVGIVENVPLNESVANVAFVTEAMAGPEDATARIGATWAAGDYFDAMGISLLSGRTFQDAEHLDNPGSVVVSQRTAQLLWPDENPLGKRLHWPRFDAWSTVVGVVEDVMQYSFRDDVQPMAYFPLVAPGSDAWAMTSPGYVIRTSRGSDLLPEVRALVRSAAPSAPMYRVFMMEDLASSSMISLTFTMVALAVSSVMALLLGAIGLYGILSSVVTERTREIGVRMALGAAAAGVRRMVVLQGVRVVGVGIVLGLIGAALVVRSLRSLLFGVPAFDPITFLLVAVTMLGIGALASYVPARRASSVDPVESLRAG